MTPKIVFDFDGTLVDSTRSVVETIRIVLHQHGVASKVEIGRRVIGPPLDLLFSSICDETSAPLIPILKKAFISYYDEAGFRNVTYFEGVDELLKSLQLRSVDLYVATNKRRAPTDKIIEMLGWKTFFRGIYAVDDVSPPFSSKAEILKHLIGKHQLDPRSVIYIGDLPDDLHAAMQCGIRFVRADWDRSNRSANLFPGDCMSAEVPAKLGTLIDDLFRSQ